ncbi:MAG: P-II family nitrogen regulator [Ruminiclostridium sp.]|nr:P-II family nitrogen regulator [Ruminiclostridium sp.]
MEELSISKKKMLTLILSENQSHKCIRLAKEKGLRGGMITIGRGTVKSTVLNLLGIKSQKREVIHFLLKSEQAEEMLEYFNEELQLKVHGHGIAYTSSVLHAIGLPGQDTGKQDAINTAQCVEGKSMFKKLTVIVERGLSDDVMDIAREAGVRGGTILHGRGASAEIATTLFGMEIEPEKELIIMLTPGALVDKVVTALSDALNLNEPGKGILFIEPILETRGLLEMNDKEDQKA